MTVTLDKSRLNALTTEDWKLEFAVHVFDQINQMSSQNKFLKTANKSGNSSATLSAHGQVDRRTE